MSISDIYKIEEQSTPKNNSIRVDLNNTHKLFQGHFPGQPILPGVVLLEILKDLVEVRLSLQLSSTHYKQVKFLGLVNPDKDKSLIYDFEIEQKNQKIFVKNQTSLADGSIVLKCNATFVEKQRL